MNKKLENKLFSIAGALLVCVVAFIGIVSLTSCDKLGIGLSAADIEKANTTSYFAELNSIAKDFDTALTDFQADVKDKNIDAMKEKVDKAQKLIDKLDKLEVPQNCEDVQKAYLDGFIQMQGALSNYVSVYSDYLGGEYDPNVLSEQITNLKHSYEQGTAMIKQADKLAAEKNKD